MSLNKSNEFFEEISKGVTEKTLVRLTLSEVDKTNSPEYKKLIIKPILIKNKLHLQFIYRYLTKDITKNFMPELALEMIKDECINNFLACTLFKVNEDLIFKRTKDGKSNVKRMPGTFKEAANLRHDKTKNLSLNHPPYLKELGIINKKGNIVQAQGNKLKQIRKYTEILDRLFESKKLYDEDKLSIADMGSGKAYLSFALVHHLREKYKGKLRFEGVELREKLIHDSNSTAEKLGFKELNFIQNSIIDYQNDQLDVLIALHACDTATDDAIFKGIKLDAQIIVVAPCCHKQLRKDMNPSGSLSLITDHGILFERQAVILTDTLRSLLLNLEGYDTKVFEFISNEHTAKNVMIVATKSDSQVNRTEIGNKISQLKKDFDVSKHHLENLLKS